MNKSSCTSYFTVLICLFYLIHLLGVGAIMGKNPKLNHCFQYIIRRMFCIACGLSWLVFVAFRDGLYEQATWEST